jgi:hypothetical protein
MTYRTIIAFFSESKSILININKFGEQYFDLLALAIIWIISIIGLIILILMLREERLSKNIIYTTEKRNKIKQNKPSLKIRNTVGLNFEKNEIKDVIFNPIEKFDEEINLKD